MQLSALWGAFLFLGFALKRRRVFPFFRRAQPFDSVFGLRRRGAVGVGLEAKQSGRRVRPGVAGAGAVAVGGVACFDIDGDAGIEAAIGTFDDVEKPGFASHGQGLGPRRPGYVEASCRVPP